MDFSFYAGMREAAYEKVKAEKGFTFDLPPVQVFLIFEKVKVKKREKSDSLRAMVDAKNIENVFEIRKNRRDDVDDYDNVDSGRNKD